MKKGLFAIRLSVVVAIVLLAALVPSCGPTTGTIAVQATLCGVPWQGAVNYTLTPGTGSPISGTSVPTTHSGVDPGSWTCAYVSGGPANSFLVNITPSATQSLKAGQRIIFTLNFELKQDAAIQFITWTVNGDPIGKPGEPFVEHKVTTCDVIDVHFKQWVDGCQGYNVTVNETSWLWITQIGGPEGVKIRVEHDPDGCAVTKTPPVQGPRPVKKSQVPSIDGKPVTPGTIIVLPGPQLPVVTKLDVETSWQLVKGLNYTKSINWLGISKSPFEPPGHRCVLFELIVPGPGEYVFTLEASADVVLVGAVDVNPANNTATSPQLTLTVNVA